jgi:Arc/MetJ family transcription regulator
MRITIDIDASDLKEIQKSTGQKKKSPAVGQALADYLRMQKKKRLIEKALAGETDFSSTNEELEARDIYETH